MTNTSSASLSFASLYERALHDWPAAIEFRQLIRHDNTRPDLYSVEGFNNIDGRDADEIAEAYIGKPDEVLMRNLHEAIISELHNVAKHCSRIEVADLRADRVRVVFEQNLRSVLDRPSLGWKEDDLKLVQQYFGLQ